jgi:hypothetical protein
MHAGDRKAKRRASEATSLRSEKGEVAIAKDRYYEKPRGWRAVDHHQRKKGKNQGERPSEEKVQRQ